MPAESPGTKLRRAWQAGPIAVPGAFNALVAKLVERAGFPATYLSGAALSAGVAGVPDVGLLSLPEFVEQARYLVRAVDIPVLSDADTGFGEAMNVERTVQLFEEAGVAGLHLEDQRLPKRCGHLSGKQLVEPAEMQAKLRAAVAARRDSSFVLIARTDARGVTGFDDAVARANAYLDAGADVIFPEALESADEFERFARAVEAPLLANMTEFGRSPLLTLSELGQMGYRIALYPVTMLRVSMKTVEQALATLKAEGTQASLLESMQTRQELYDVLGYEQYEARDREYFGRGEWEGTTGSTGNTGS
jgi:methylisocitrate lyase